MHYELTPAECYKLSMFNLKNATDKLTWKNGALTVTSFKCSHKAAVSSDPI